MMHKTSIYLSGGVSKLSFPESDKWRRYVRNEIMNEVDIKEIDIYNPNDYYNVTFKSHDTEREVMDFDMWWLKKSDIVIVNFNHRKSIGTAMELAVAYDMGKPIIGLNEGCKKLHPWLECVCSKIFDDIDDMIAYVVEFYFK